MFRPHEIEWDSTSISNLWNYYANDQYFSDMYFTRVHGLQIVKYLTGKVSLRNKNVLDFGSGPGYLFEKMISLQSGAHYSALDFSEESIKVLKEKFESNELFREAYYVSRLPSGIPSRFDVVIACEVFEHLNDEYLDQAVGEIRRLLSPNGLVFLTTPNNEDLNSVKRICPECGCIYHQWQHVRTWTKSTLANYMETNGFEALSVDAVLFADLKAKMKFYLKSVVESRIEKPNIAYLGKLRS